MTRMAGDGGGGGVMVPNFYGNRGTGFLDLH